MTNIPTIQSYKPIIPMIYAYTTPTVPEHQGWTKIGYTDSQTVKQRIAEQTHTADIQYKLLWTDNAIYKDGSGVSFTDHDFHRFLTDKCNVERKPKTEWFHIDGSKARELFDEFASRDFSNVQSKNVATTSSYTLRSEQQKAVDMTRNYFKKHGKGGKFLWNAKPRFGKTLSSYDLAKSMDLQNVLIVTNRPSIANSWFTDFQKFIGWQTNYKFVTDNDALAKKGTLSRKEFVDSLETGNEFKQIAFESLQGLKRSVYFGGNSDKLEWIKDLKWDLLIVDEAHEGVDTYKTDKAFDKIDRKYTLYLTGTPFKALAQGKFSEDQIFNWSYADEQKRKETWNEEKEGSSSPYAVMPRLNLFTYQMSEFMEQKARQKVDLQDDNQVDPAFDLNEFFRVKSNGQFVYDEYVDNFLNSLTTSKKYPFSTPELREELAHTFWLLHRVDSAKALAKKLKKHPIFGDYEVVVAAGDGKLNDDQLSDDDLSKANEKSFDLVQKAIKKYPKTITLSVGQLTTGVTIPAWSGVMMLSNMKSPAEYMQAAFRSQNPYKFRRGAKIVQKESAYVFDFDPARTLTIFDDFANNLKAKTANGRGTAEEHEHNIKELLNFFPVIGEDDQGEMVPLDAKQVMSIPRHLKSNEVVKHGFMSNFLFNNIGRIFATPGIVTDILEHLPTAQEEKNRKQEDSDELSKGMQELDTDDEGNIDIPEEKIIGKSTDLFGSKVYSDAQDDLKQATDDFQSQINDEPEPENTDVDSFIDQINDQISQTVTKTAVEQATQEHDLTKRETDRFQKQIDKENKQKLAKIADEYKDETKIAKTEFKKKQAQAQSDDDLKQAQQDYNDHMQSLLSDFTQKVTKHVEQVSRDTPQDVVSRVEQHTQEERKKTFEDDIRAHLRGFSRTIPSFLMAYGDRKTTLANFDDYTEDDVFKEVTGITENQFKFLRDGGNYTDPETGEQKYFEGHLFDEVVFNDSIQQFLDKREQLANYFEENSKEDIFDYIPPQRNNQIFTPKKVVKHMVDDLEANNPGIFDNPNKTFADLYMKSGLYITEIIKRLYRSEKMKKLYPNNKERLIHIINHQVYGLAPTRIIYLIATNYILGFDKSIKDAIDTSHFKQADSAEACENGTLQELIDKEFGTN